MPKDKNHKDDAWTTLAKTITPLKNRPKPPTPPKRKRFVKENDGGDIPISWKASRQSHMPRETDHATKKRVTKGRQPIDATVDLHDHTQDIAHDRLKRALIRGVKRGDRCLLVITGKGGARPHRAARQKADSLNQRDLPRGDGVLKRVVPLWLKSPELSPMISSFTTAHNKHGGEGALYVFLRKKPATASHTVVL